MPENEKRKLADSRKNLPETDAYPARELLDPADEDDMETAGKSTSTKAPYLHNRELSWLSFNERVLDQGADDSVQLLERLNFISIFRSNLQEFFMVRVGSLTDLSYIKTPVHDSKTGMTPQEQIAAIHERCHELYPIEESIYERVRGNLAKEGIRHLRPIDISAEQRAYLSGYMEGNVKPFLSPQIINSRHPFPHLENGALYIIVRLDEEPEPEPKKKSKKDKTAKSGKKPKDQGAEGALLGLIPLPHQCDRVIKLPGRGFPFILLEHVIEEFAAEIFSMYHVKHTNVICVTRNADLDDSQGNDAADEDYREHMKRILRRRARLAPVRLECERPLSAVLQKLLLKRLDLKPFQVYDTAVPLDMGFTWSLPGKLTTAKREKLTNAPFSPQWPASIDRNRRIIDQVCEREVLLSYPYESMDPFIQLLREAAHDPTVTSIKITLYRLASQSHLAEALIAAAEAGKEVTALFELRARFDEFNNIEWSQRFEQAGCNVIYGFRDYKVHSKICCITRQTPHGVQHITQLGTGNYNEKTARLYTDLSFITTNEAFGRDAVEFFRNMGLENISDNYQVIQVAPLQIKRLVLARLDGEIAKARRGEACGAFLKTNSVTDRDIIEKIAEASQAGVPVTLLVRGICCIVPNVKGFTDHVRVVSIVGRLLEHSRIYCFGAREDCVLYLSSADLMTRNMDKRIEIAWPILNDELRKRILGYIDVYLADTAKLRELRPDNTYTPLGAFVELDEEGNPQPFDSQEYLIREAQSARKQAALAHASQGAEAPATSGAPAAPGAPATSAEPATSGAPVAPGAPATSAEPATSEAPVAPATSAEPAASEAPGKPAEAAATSGKPAASGTPATSAESDAPDKPGTPDASESPAPPIAAASNEPAKEAVENAPDARQAEPIEVEARIEETAHAALVVAERPCKQGFLARIARLLSRRRRR